MVTEGLTVMRYGPHYGVFDCQRGGSGVFVGFFQEEEAKRQFIERIRKERCSHE